MLVFNLVCRHCGNGFTKPYGKGRPAAYCAQECAKAAKRLRRHAETQARLDAGNRSSGIRDWTL